ncbi:MAG: hypothetical protein N2202_03565 [Proteobacteria bacterium]|nr:hypothetical protein [Pseudomonadota bacterium]
MYKIVYHKPGIIKIEVPLLKKLSISKMNKAFSILSEKYANSAIREISANPLTGKIIILYSKGQIDILNFLKEISNDDFFKSL